MAGKKKELEVDEHNIIFYEVEANDDFNIDKCSDEEKQSIYAENDAFIAKTVQPALLNMAAPCNCQMPRINERIQARLKLGVLHPGPDGRVGLELTQEDVDTRDFGVVVSCVDGKYQQIELIVNHCKGCGDVHLYCNGINTVHDITRLLATGIADGIASRTPPALTGATAQYVMENLETGELTEDDNLNILLCGDYNLES